MKKALSLLVVLVLTSCGGTIKETKQVQVIPKIINKQGMIVEMPDIMKVAIFPLADYSFMQSSLCADEWGGRIKIIEEITDNFIAHGVLVAIQEDVNELLKAKGIIKPIEFEGIKTKREKNPLSGCWYRQGNLEYELMHGNYSEDMQYTMIEMLSEKNLVEFLCYKEIITNFEPELQGVTKGLSREMIKELNMELGVDVIIRGRILEYGTKTRKTLNPLHRGLLPLLLEPVYGVFFGARPDEPNSYEEGLPNLENILTGSGIGYIVGHQSHEGAEGAGIGALTGYLASRSSDKLESKIVQIRLYAQNAWTGDLLWSNRSEIDYASKSIFDNENKHPKTMFDKAIEKAVKELVNDFFE